MTRESAPGQTSYLGRLAFGVLGALGPEPPGALQGLRFRRSRQPVEVGVQWTARRRVRRSSAEEWVPAPFRLSEGPEEVTLGI